jgi:hypothetical protein
VVAPGQFRDPVPNTGIGVQRLFTAVGGEVYYTSNTNTAGFVGPTIEQATSSVNGSSATLQVVTDTNARRVFVLARDLGATGTVNWVGLDLTPNGTTWTGSLPVSAAGIQFIVQAVDANGNVSVSSNKALDFSTNTAPAPQPPVIDLSGATIVNGWYTSPPTMTLTAPSGQPLSSAIDGTPFVPYAGPAPVPSIDGSHLIEARDQAGDNSVKPYQLDANPPTVTATLTDQSTNTTPTGWVNGPVTVALTATDGNGSGVASISYSINGGPTQTVNGASTSFSLTADGTNTILYWAADNVGHMSTAASAKAQIDTTPPVVACSPAPAGWQGTEVTISCTASDSGSGLANPADATFSLSTSVGVGNVSANASTNTHLVCDNLNHCTKAGPITGLMVDLQKPTITITTPAPDGSTVVALGATLTPIFGCSDGNGSGVASCTASPVSTSTAGTYTFTVTATDEATPPNTRTQSVTYTVGYGVCLGYMPNQTKNIGSTFPIKLQLCDASGNNLSSAQISILAYSIDGGPPPPPNFSGNSNFGNLFRYDSSAKSYIYNLSTGGQTWSVSGMHVMYFSVNGVTLPAYIAPFTLG